MSDDKIAGVLSQCTETDTEHAARNQGKEQKKMRKFVIGQGAFGRVYRFKDPLSKQCYAIKKVDLKLVQSCHFLKKQSQIHAKVSGHRNIVTFYGNKAVDHWLYYMFEYANGGDLSNLSQSPSIDELWEIVMQLGLGLLHLRKNQILHRDIKLENILMKKGKRGGQQQVIFMYSDFGLAMELKDDSDTTNQQCGSPIYMAPEICKGDFYSYPVDVWSLGITLFQLANNLKFPYADEIENYIVSRDQRNEPFENQEFINYVKGIIKTKQIKSKHANSQMNRLIERMLHLNPSKRCTPHQILETKSVLKKLKEFTRRESSFAFKDETLLLPTVQEEPISKQYTESDINLLLSSRMGTSQMENKIC